MSDHKNLWKERSTYMQQLWVPLDECKACASKMESLFFNGMWKSKVKPKLPLFLLPKVWLHSQWSFCFKNFSGSASIWAVDSHGQLYFKSDPLAATEVVDNAGGPMKHIEGQGSSNHPRTNFDEIELVVDSHWSWWMWRFWNQSCWWCIFPCWDSEKQGIKGYPLATVSFKSTRDILWTAVQWFQRNRPWYDC